MKTAKRLRVRDLAKLANVSRGTVDRALNGRGEINETTRKRILALARENGYAPNLTARALSFSRSSLRIGLCIPRELRYFYDQMRGGFMDEAQSYAHIGVETLYRPIKKLDSPACAAIRGLLNSHIDALVLTEGNSKEIVPLIEEAEKKRNVRVVCIGSDTISAHRSTSISVNAELIGSMAAELMVNVVRAGSGVAVITGPLSVANHRRKLDSFQRAFLAGSRGGKVVEVIQEQADEQIAYRKTLRLLRQHPRLAGIYVATAICMPVCRAVESEGLTGKIKIISTDLFAEMVPCFTSGLICASLYQDPYRQSQMAVRLLLEHFLHGKAFPRVCNVNPVVVLRSNLGLFREIQNSPYKKQLALANG